LILEEWPDLQALCSAKPATPGFVCQNGARKLGEVAYIVNPLRASRRGTPPSGSKRPWAGLVFEGKTAHRKT
jgi:hypothetical protein